jgi:hypothetical protein
MKIKLLLLVSLFATVPLTYSLAGGDVKYKPDPLTKTFKPAKTSNYAFQTTMRQQQAWKKFLAAHGQWNVIFNESNGKPKMAFGQPVAIGGSDARSTAENFINAELRDFNVPFSALTFRSISNSSKYFYANYYQKYNGLDVLFSAVQVKMTQDYKVMQFKLDCFDNITLNTNPALATSAAASIASTGVPGFISALVTPELKVLPVPQANQYVFHLVYEVIVSNRDAEDMPGKYYTLVDAANGTILYRVNMINHIVANTDINMSGTLYVTNPYDATSVEPLRNMKIVVGGNPDFTDNSGYLGLTNTSSVQGDFSLEGKWVKVQTNNITPSWSVMLNPGVNNLNVDANTDIRQRSTYHSVNVVHDFMKTKYPTFTGLDWALPANVDVAGSCNAFYDGSSINFFAAGGGCNATALVADVCYHEYGHGINDLYYQSQGFSFQNGAMGEGYADIWALGITDSPILGIGFFSNDPAGFVRRYDIDKKVYPQDLVGEVHADGEIIAGCFWDTYLNLGNLTQMMDLFSQSFNAGITGMAGDEGSLFQQVLLEVLTLDDNDGNITNGTPNYCEITSAFAIHGITLGAAAGLNHTEVLAANGMAPVIVQANVQGLGSTSLVKGNYRIGNSGPFNNFTFNNVGGNNYEGTIPPQPNGTIIEYYIGIEDDCGTFINVLPSGAADANPNIPYYILVGFSQLLFEDFDVFAGNWITGLPSDDAVTGQWTIDVPIPSYVGTALVQPDVQHTPGGLFCAFTGNAANPGSGAGDNDVDDGKTTMISPVYDLSTYTNPAFTIYRWYSNDQGATPGTDFWQVSISGDGINYVPLENTDVADHSWRRFAFRVMDYILPTSTVSIKFIAEDANAGSLVEAAVDDLILWDEIPTGIPSSPALATLSLFPNPASSQVNLNIGLRADDKIEITISNIIGQQVYSAEMVMNAGNNIYSVDAAQFASGLYEVRVNNSAGSQVKKISITK